MRDPIFSQKRLKTVCFTGHRDIPSSLEEQVLINTKKVIAALYDKGYRHFVAGGALGFDTIAARAVLAARNYYGDVTLELCLPCRDQAKNWSEADRQTYEDIKRCADTCTYIYEHYCRGCMQARNRAMVDQSSFCVAYITKNTGGTAMTVDYATKNGLRLCNVAAMCRTNG